MVTFDEAKNTGNACLQSAKDFLTASEKLNDGKVPHICFHLALLALEDLGKANLIEAEYLFNNSETSKDFKPDFIDHEKKLFWALCAGLFMSGRQVTRQELEEYSQMAKTLHDRRLETLYINPTNPLLPVDKIEQKEVDLIISFVRVKIEMQETRQLTNINDEENYTLLWFFKAADDTEKAKLIFSAPSFAKLEELGETKLWLNWLKDTFDKNDLENKELLKKELERPQPPEGEELDPKWKIRIKLQSPSHSIKQKELNNFNSVSQWYKLFMGDKKKNELILEVILSKNVSIYSLWAAGWDVSKMFIISLNIGSRGVFWWNTPRDVDRYYEDIEDLENKGAMVRPVLQKRLQLAWHELHQVLKENDLAVTGLIFTLVIAANKQQTAAFVHYSSALGLWAKTDVHFHFEVNAFEEFFQSFKVGLIEWGLWDGKADLVEVAKLVLNKQLTTTENLEKTLLIGINMTHGEIQSTEQITLTEVFAMKLYCDLLFLELAQRKLDKEGRPKALVSTSAIND